MKDGGGGKQLWRFFKVPDIVRLFAAAAKLSKRVVLYLPRPNWELEASLKFSVFMYDK